MIGIKSLVTEHNGRERVVELRWDAYAIYRLQERRPDIRNPVAYWFQFGTEVDPSSLSDRDVLEVLTKIPPDRDIIDWIWCGLLWKNKGATLDHAIQVYTEFPGEMVNKAFMVAQEILPTILESLGVKADVSAPSDPTLPGTSSPGNGTADTGMTGKPELRDTSGSPETSSGRQPSVTSP